MLPASVMTKRFGGVAVMAVGAFVGAGSAWATTQATDGVLAALRNSSVGQPGGA